MKIPVIPCFLILPLLASIDATAAEEPPKYRDAATHEQLARAMRYAEKIDPMKKLDAAKGEDPSKKNQPTNLLEDSDIVCFNGLFTLVPKRAILASPARLKDRLKIQPGSRIVAWTEFFAANRGWITTVEVSRVQAEGNKPLAEETAEQISKSSNLVVATYLGGPISVLPLKAPETDTAAEPKLKAEPKPVAPIEPTITQP